MKHGESWHLGKRLESAFPGDYTVMLDNVRVNGRSIRIEVSVSQDGPTQYNKHCANAFYCDSGHQSTVQSIEPAQSVQCPVEPQASQEAQEASQP